MCQEHYSIHEGHVCSIIVLRRCLLPGYRFGSACAVSWPLISRITGHHFAARVCRKLTIGPRFELLNSVD